MIELYRHTKDCGNQTSFVSSTSAVDKDPKETVIGAGNRVIENAEENTAIFFRHSAAQESRKQPSFANSRSSRRRQIDEIELKNLRAEKETEQRLRERQLELEKEHEEIELRRQQEELRLKQHQREQEFTQQEDEPRVRQH